MPNLNRVVICGNCTKTPELRQVGDRQTSVCNLSIAVNDRFKIGEKWVDEATFLDVTCWAHNAELAAQQLSKGSPVLVEGRLKQETWEKNGSKQSKLKIVCEKLVIFEWQKKTTDETSLPRFPDDRAF